MTDPYRDIQLRCPACPDAPLREYRTRLCCDTCQGMLLAVDDLKTAIQELTGIEPTLEFVDVAEGKRKCPSCPALMSTCKVRVVLEDELAKPRPMLDTCIAHGVWFDGEELAKVFEKIRGKVSGGTAGAGAWQGNRGGFEWWGGGGRWNG